MTILVLGKHGQLGVALVQAFAGRADVVALDRNGPGDLSKPDELGQYVRELKPKVILNAGAYTAVDRAEDEASLAFTINSQAPAALAAAARDLGALLVHYSSDYVYGGAGDLSCWRPSWFEIEPPQLIGARWIEPLVGIVRRRSGTRGSARPNCRS